MSRRRKRHSWSPRCRRLPSSWTGKRPSTRLVSLAAEAAKQRREVIVFPEAFVPAYPDWVWTVPGGNSGMHRELYGELLDQSVGGSQRRHRKAGQEPRKRRAPT